MHRLLPISQPDRAWAPRLSPAWVRFWTPFRRLAQRHVEKIDRVELRGIEHLRQACDAGHSVLITPNHFTYSDPFLLHHAADAIGRCAHFMTAWQVFGTSNRLKQWVLQTHGCFSVNREGADIKAFRTAVDIVQQGQHPLVIFPEGEMYRIGDRVTPFREGPASIALAAAKRAGQPVVCVPCGLKYRYLDDVMPALLQLADRLEQALFWRPTPERPLEERIYRLAEGALALKEIEYTGRTIQGPLRERLQRLAGFVLERIEPRYGLKPGADIPERVRALRQQALKRLSSDGVSEADRRQMESDLDDAFFVMQVFCYPGDYVSERPDLERMAQTLDKLEEDLLGIPFARPRGRRAAIVSFGEPVPVEPERQTPESLTRMLEDKVQELIDGIQVVNAPATESLVSRDVGGTFPGA